MVFISPSLMWIFVIYTSDPLIQCPFCGACICVHLNVRTGSNMHGGMHTFIVNPPLYFYFLFFENINFLIEFITVILNSRNFFFSMYIKSSGSNVTAGKLAIRLPISLASFLIVTLLQDNIFFESFLIFVFYSSVRDKFLLA